MVLQMLSSFSLYRDIAPMYLAVDAKVTQQGLVLVDRLSTVSTDKSLSNDAFFEKQRKTLSENNTDAEATVHGIVKALSHQSRSEERIRTNQVRSSTETR
jgi:hypothetical protein